MKKSIARMLSLGLVTLLGLGGMITSQAYAEEVQGSESSEEATTPGTNISLTPVSKILQISSNSVYEDYFTVKNEGSADMKIEVYASPYSYVYSSEEDSYKLGFNSENNFTQISRWITFKDKDGNYAKNPTFTIAPGDSLDVYYRITTPDNIPAGGQYAVMFAHTLNGVVAANGIKTEASPGIVVYGRSTEGEAITAAEISDMRIEQKSVDGGNGKTVFSASAKVKNTGNVDFSASGVLKVEPILGGPSYETQSTSGRVSIIPEAELAVTDEWADTPDFGLYKVTWTVMAGNETQVIEKVIFLISPIAIIVTIILLTIIIVWTIIMVRKRKARRSRFAV